MTGYTFVLQVFISSVNKKSGMPDFYIKQHTNIILQF